MNSIYPAVITVCAAVLICSILSNFICEGSVKKIFNLVMGAFLVCSLIVPAINAVKSLTLNLSELPQSEELISTYDELYNTQVVYQTKENLELSVRDILSQNGIQINNCEIVLSLTDESSIIISSIDIYIYKDDVSQTETIREITEKNFGINPNIITE